MNYQNVLILHQKQNKMKQKALKRFHNNTNKFKKTNNTKKQKGFYYEKD